MKCSIGEERKVNYSRLKKKPVDLDILFVKLRDHLVKFIKKL